VSCYVSCEMTSDQREIECCKQLTESPKFRASSSYTRPRRIVLPKTTVSYTRTVLPKTTVTHIVLPK